MTVREWLRIHEPDIYSGKVFKHAARRDECVTVFEDYAERQWKLRRTYEPHLTL